VNDEQRKTAGLPGVDDPGYVANVAIWSWIEDVEGTHTSLFDVRSKLRDVRFTFGGRLDRKPKIARAIDVRGIDGRNLELGARRLWLLAVAPTDGDTLFGKPERAALRTILHRWSRDRQAW
jgi:hypothetical protein